MACREFHFYNRFHIGDNLLNLKYLLYLSPILKKLNYVIYYYYNTDWVYNKRDTLLSYTDPDVVKLRSLNQLPPNSIELWMAHQIGGIDSSPNFEQYFNGFYANILKHLHIDNMNLSTDLWVDEPFLIPIYHSLDEQFKDIDILILNNRGHSGQFSYTSHLNDLARYLHTTFKIVTAVHVDDTIPHTGQLTMQQIGAISTRAKYVITTFSGPQVPCYNMLAKQYVKKWIIMSDGCLFRFHSIDHMCVLQDVQLVKIFFDTLQIPQRQSS